MRRFPPAALLLALVIALCGACQRSEVAPEPPDDALEYTPVAVPETTAHWQGEMAGEVRLKLFGGEDQ